MTHPSNKFVEVTICRARGLLSRDTNNAVAPITSESLEIFVVASSTHRVSDEDLRTPQQLMEPQRERVQLLRTPAVASSPVNPTWPSDEAGVQKCRFQCPVAAAPLVFDIFGATLSRELFLGRATLGPEMLLRAADTAAAGLSDNELRLELLPREDEDDPVILSAIEKFFTGLGLLVISLRIVDAPPPPPAPEPAAELIEITVPKLDVLSPSKRPPLAPMLVDVPHAHQVRPGLVDVTQDMQDAAIEREQLDPALPLHVAQMVEISLLNCSAVISTWLSELRAVASLLAPGKPPPPPPPKFEIVAEAFGGIFSSGLLSTNVEDLLEQRQSSLSLFSVYGTVCAPTDAKIPMRLRFVDATDLVNAEKEALRSETTSVTSTAQQQSSSAVSAALGFSSSSAGAAAAGKPLHNGREVFAETVVPGVPVPSPEQQHGANSVNPESAAGIVGNRVVVPVRFNDRLGGSSNKAAVELAVKSVSCVPAKSITESQLYHGKGLLKIEVREARDLLTPHMIAAAIAAARGPSAGSLRSTGGLSGSGGVGSTTTGGSVRSSRRSPVPAAAARRPSPAGGNNSPEQQQQNDDDTSSEKSAKSNKSAKSSATNRTHATTTRTSRSTAGGGITSQYAAAAANAAAVAAQPPDPVYCEVAIKDRLDDRELKVLGKSPFVPAEADAFFGFTATVEMDNLRQLPEAVVVSVYQGGAVIARSVVHVMERRSIDGTWVTLKPPVRKGVSQGDGLRGMVWVRWVASPQQQQSALQQEREQALAIAGGGGGGGDGGASALAPVRWIRSDTLIPDLVRSPAAPNGICEMLLPDTAPPYACAALQRLQPHELGYREAGALCIDWNALPVGYAVRIKQGTRTIFGPALRVHGHQGSALKAPPVVVFLEGTVDGALPLVFETFRCPEDGAPLVVRQSDRVYERKCWLPVDVNALQRHPPAAVATDALTTSTTGLADAFEGSFLTHLNTMLLHAPGFGSSSSSSRFSDSFSHHDGGRHGNNNGKPAAAELPQHPPCFNVALDEIAAINIACRWVPLIKKMPPPPPIVRHRSRSRSPETQRDGCSDGGGGGGGNNKKKFKKPPMALRISGPGFPPLSAQLEEEEDTLEKIAPLVERHFGIPAKDQVYFQNKLKLMMTGRPQAAGTGSKQQAKHVNNVMPVVRRLAGEGEDKQLPVTEITLQNRDSRALSLSVKLPCGLVVPLAVPHQTTVSMLKALLKQAVAERQLADPVTGEPLADAAASINRLCHLNKILRDDSTVRNLGLRPEVPLLAMAAGPSSSPAAAAADAASRQRQQQSGSQTPEDPAVSTGRQSPPPIAPPPPVSQTVSNNNNNNNKPQPRAPLTPAGANAQKKKQQQQHNDTARPAGQQQQQQQQKENTGSAAVKSPLQRYNIPPIQNVVVESTSPQQHHHHHQQEIAELRAQLSKAQSRISELESTVERQRGLLRRVAESMHNK